MSLIICIDTTFGDKPVHIEISDALGAGAETYYVSMHGYYVGRLWKMQYGWRHDLNPKSELTGDDVQILIDLIEEDLMNRKWS
jgi:hypothetical protein